MSETLSRRVGRLVSGGFHALIDAAENLAPEAVMNESIREIERAVDEVRAELGKVLAQKHLASKKMADESNRHEAIDANLQAAVAAGRDDLAEAGIAEQMDIEARLPVLENTIADCAAQETELEGFIAALQAKKREMQQQLQDWRAAQQNEGAGNTAGSDLNRIARSAEKSGNAFDRIMGRQNAIHSSTDAAQLAKLKELEDLSRSNRIAERLAALKANSKE
ncbi:PspA/IM30 family protein [Eikenella sp. S3360]|uniref:PspA/IM30 family protein n=1 Tax=Eikenella glucosivorans TaxID=2766967 RepID=A0ABS0ND47_9NEIS|nr:PspA/IM30 family protein [Eikenella glucosivorans]MBH5330185.1 PspA/IM30 family protein [Eikenella glucosivorans]